MGLLSLCKVQRYGESKNIYQMKLVELKIFSSSDMNYSLLRC